MVVVEAERSLSVLPSLSTPTKIVAHTKQSTGTKSFVAGLSAGCVSTVAGYIPDTIKVRLQTQSITQPQYSGAVQCFVKMIRDEGPMSLFKGMAIPLFSRAIINALCFSSYTYSIGVFSKNSGDHGAPHAPHLGYTFLAGGFAGAVSALVASPSEMVKVQLQVGGAKSGPIHQISQILGKVGLRGMFVGMTPTIARDFVCMGTFFTTTAVVSRVLSANNVATSPLTSLGAGALAGIFGWALCYPFDVWKSNAQDFMKGNGPIQSKSRSFRSFFQDRYANMGFRGFYTGLAPTLFRSAPTNAAKFFTFDLTIRLMNIMDGKR